MNKLLFIFIMIVMIMSPPLFSTSPTMILGLGIGSLLVPDEEELLYNDWILNTGGLFSHRSKLSDIGYYSLFSSISAGFMYTEPFIYSDEEIILLEAGFHFKNSKLLFMAGFESSITGTYVTLPFYCPEWELVYYFITERKKVQPFLSYQGYYTIEPEGEEDIFYQGTELGIEYRPTVTNGCKAGIGLGWGNWPEYPVYSDSGTPSHEIRNDLLCTINGKLNGIYKFFLDWEIVLSVLIRWSNANDYIEGIDYVNEKSEDFISITMETNLEWSPSRYIHIKLHPFFTPGIYFNKKALTPDGSFKDENVREYTTGGNFHFDWTPDNSLYVLFEAAGMIYFSNHQNELNWNTLFHLGLEYSLKF